MIVKRISYFTFMVAITTMATVSSCQKANAHTISPEDFKTIVAALREHELFDFGLHYEDTTEDYDVKLQKLLKSKGLKGGILQVKPDPSGKEKILNLILVVDKNYRGGSVATTLFDSNSGHFLLGNTYGFCQSDKLYSFPLLADIRSDIARKNLILLI